MKRRTQGSTILAGIFHINAEHATIIHAIEDILIYTQMYHFSFLLTSFKSNFGFQEKSLMFEID